MALPAISQPGTMEASHSPAAAGLTAVAAEKGPVRGHLARQEVRPWYQGCRFYDPAAGYGAARRLPPAGKQLLGARAAIVLNVGLLDR